MTKERWEQTPFGGTWGERDHDVAQRGAENRQLEQVYADADERRARGRKAIGQLAHTREQLLALSILILKRASIADRECRYDEAVQLYELAYLVRQVRANQTVPVLDRIAETPNPDPI